jgi:hypothetical protein
MKYRKLDVNGDYTFGKSAQNFFIDNDAVSQAITTNLLLLQGEWWEDTSQGLPLFQSILRQSNTPGNIKSIDLLIKDRILSTQGVLSINNYTGTYTNRIYTINCEVETQYGSATVQIPLNVT